MTDEESGFVISCKKCNQIYLNSKQMVVPPICKHFYANQRSEQMSREHTVGEQPSRLGTYQTFFDSIDGRVLTKRSGRTFHLLKRRFKRRNG